MRVRPKQAACAFRGNRSHDHEMVVVVVGEGAGAFPFPQPNITSSSAEVFLMEAGMEGGSRRDSGLSSFLACDASLPGGQHVVEGVSADAGPAEGANQRGATK